MNKEVRVALDHLEAAVVVNMCNECDLSKLVEEFAAEVSFEFDLVAGLTGVNECIEAFDAVRDYYEDEEYTEGIAYLKEFLEEHKAKKSEYILEKNIGGETRARVFLECFLFKMFKFEEDYEEEFEDDEGEPLENEGYC